MCFNGGGPEARWATEPSYPLSMVPLGVLRLSECSELWSWACDRMNEVVMRCNAGAGWALRMANARGVESVLWSEGEGRANCGLW